MSPTSYLAALFRDKKIKNTLKKVERETRLELATVCLEGRSSSQLSYSRFMVVRMRRLELPHREAPDPKSGVSTNFTTSATNFYD